MMLARWRVAALFCAPLLALPAAVMAQSHGGHHGHGAGPTTCTAEHAAMGHCSMPEQQGHEAHDMLAPKPESSGHDHHGGHSAPTPPETGSAAEHGMDHGSGGTALAPGNAPAPAAPTANYADRIWGAGAMAASRDQLYREHGGGMFSQIMFDLAEYRVQKGEDGFHWSGEGWFGGDINRLIVKSEGAATLGEGVESAEIQLLYSRAIDPYFNLQAGVRHDIRPDPSRTYAVIGLEGLAPYWFEVEGHVFLSDKGDLFARVGGYYDQRITQRWILQPSAEVNFAAQDVPENGVGSGLGDVELGLRLRHEIVREFAPYIGIAWERKFGETARLARAAGEEAEATSLVLGIRAWF